MQTVPADRHGDRKIDKIGNEKQVQNEEAPESPGHQFDFEFVGMEVDFEGGENMAIGENEDEDEDGPNRKGS